MSKECPHELQWGVVVVDVRTACMPQQVRVPLFRIQAFRFRHSFHDAPYRTHVQPFCGTVWTDADVADVGATFRG